MKKISTPKLVTGFTILAAAIMYAFYLITFTSFNKTISESNNDSENLKAMRYLEELLISTQTLESNQRAFVISYNQSYLNNYQVEAQKISTNLDSLKELKKKDSVYTRQLEVLVSLVNQKIEFSKKQIELAKAGNTKELVKNTNAGTGRVLMEKIKEQIFHIEEDIRTVLRSSAEVKKETARIANKQFIYLGFISIIVLAGLYFRIQYDLRKRFYAENKLKQFNEELYKKVEEQTADLKKLNERYELILKATNDAIWDWDIKNNTITGNKVYQDLLIYDPSQPQPSFEQFLKRVHPDDLQRMMEDYRLALAEKSAFLSDEYRFLMPSGEYRHFFDRAYLHFNENGEPMRMLGAMQDITEIKKAQQEIFEYAQLLDSVTNSLPGVIVYQSYRTAANEATINFMSKNTLELLGYDVQKFYDDPLFIYSLIPPQYAEQVEKSRSEAVSNKEFSSFEVPLTASNGEIKWFISRFHPKATSDGGTLSNGTLTDITQVKKIEEELKESEEKYRTLVEEAGEGIFIADRNGRFIMVNSTGCKFSQYTLDELKQKTIYDLVEPASLKEHPFNFDEMAKGKTVSSERKMMRKDGVIVDVEISAKFISEGRFLAFVRDISERKKAEEELKMKEERFRTIFDKASDAIFISQMDGNFIEINSTACNLLGYTKEELLKMGPRNLITEENLLNTPFKMQELIDGNTVQLERSLKHKNGSIIETEVSARLLGDGRMISIIRDVRERNEYIRKIRESENNLRHILTSGEDIYYVIDLNYNIILINRAAERLLSEAWGTKVYAGANVLDVFPKTGKEPVKANFDKVFSGLTIEYELQQKIEGLPEWLIVTIEPVRDSENKITGASVTTKDITQLKKAIEEITDYKYALDQAAIVSLTDASGILKYVNDNFCDISKYNREELIGNHHKMIESEYHSKEFIENMWSTVGKGKIWRGEICKKAKDNSIYWVDATIVPFLDGSGKPYQYLAIRFDITERKKIQEEVRQKEEEYRNLIERITDGFFSLDKNWQFLYVNQKIVDITGIKADDLVGKNIWQVFPDSVNSSTYHAVHKALDTQQYQYVVDYYEPLDLWQENHIYPSPDGISLFLHDISEQKRAERELRDNEEKYRLLFDKNPLPAWLFDLNSLRFIDVNESAIRDYGYSKEEFLGMTILDIRPEEEKNRLQELIRQKPHDYQTSGFWTLLRKDKTSRQVELYSHEINYKGIAARIVLASDVTENLKAQQQIIETTEQLRQLSGYLQNIREEERTNLSREIHDELGQQLTALKMDITNIKKKLKNSDSKVSEMLDESTVHIDETIRTVRRIATSLRPGILDDLGLVAAMEWQSAEFEKRTGIKTVFIDKTNDMQTSREIATTLFRVFQESLTNVARHAKAKKVNITLEEDLDELILSIKDNGNGFDTEVIKQKKSLGLLGIRERVLNLQGTYSISSQPDQGTTVKVTIPITTVK